MILNIAYHNSASTYRAGKSNENDLGGVKISPVLEYQWQSKREKQGVIRKGGYKVRLVGIQHARTPSYFSPSHLELN